MAGYVKRPKGKWRCLECGFVGKHRGAINLHAKNRQWRDEAEREKHTRAEFIPDEIQPPVEPTHLAVDGQPIPDGKPLPVRKATVPGAFTDNPTLAALIRLVPRTYEIINSPALITPYIAAVATGFPGNLQEFLTLVSWDFFLSRGVNPSALAAGAEVSSMVEASANAVSGNGGT